MKIAAAILGGIALVVALAIGGWKLGWWASEESTNRRARIDNDSFARQAALREDATDKARTVADIEVQITSANESQKRVLVAQRGAVVDQFCNAFGQLQDTTTVPLSVVDLGRKECA